MKSIIHIFKTYKPLIILIFVLFLIIKIGFQVKYLTFQEHFYDTPSHLLINNNDQATSDIDLTNLIVKNYKSDGSNFQKGKEHYLQNGFLHIYNKLGKDKFDKDTYTTDLPQLIIHSYSDVLKE